MGARNLAQAADEQPRTLPPSMVERMTLILEAFDSPTRRLTLEQVSQRTTLPRSTAHRILDQLVRLDWLEHDERYVRTEEFIRVLRGLLTEDEYTQHGKYYDIDGFTLNPKPVDVPGRPHPEIFFGGNSTAAQATAGRVADWYFSNGKDLEGFKENIAGVVASA